MSLLTWSPPARATYCPDVARRDVESVDRVGNVTPLLFMLARGALSSACQLSSLRLEQITSSCFGGECTRPCTNTAPRSLVADNERSDIMAQAMSLLSTAPHASKIAHRRPDRSATSTHRKSSNPRVSRTRAEASADGSLERRELLAGAATSLVSIAAFPRVARADEPATTLTQVYNDEEDKYSLAVPSDWERALGDTSPNPQSTRKVIAFYPPGQPDINVNVVATALGADYPKMGSFGSPDEFAYGVAAGMTRPKPRQGPKQFSYVVDAKNAGDKYVIEYTVERPEENFYQHLLSAVGIGYNGRVNRLFTLTAVCPEDRYAEMEPMFRKIFATFETPSTLYP